MLLSSGTRRKHAKSREWKYAFATLSVFFHFPGLFGSGYSLIIWYWNIKSFGPFLLTCRRALGTPDNALLSVSSAHMLEGLCSSSASQHL